MLLRYNVYTGNDIGKIESTQTQAAKKISGFPCWPFGSYARGDATSNSDIDIAVEISAPMGLNFIAMADEIESLFGIKTDVVTKRSIKTEYLHNVEKDIVYV